jgi:hypothetical protein
MFNFLEKLRAKPEKTKRRIAFLFAFCFAGAIFVVWLSVIYPNFRQTLAEKEKNSNLEPSPSKAFTEILSDGFANIGVQFSKIKSLTNLLSSPETYQNSSEINSQN